MVVVVEMRQVARRQTETNIESLIVVNNMQDRDSAGAARRVLGRFGRLGPGGNSQPGTGVNDD